MEGSCSRPAAIPINRAKSITVGVVHAVDLLYYFLIRSLFQFRFLHCGHITGSLSILGNQECPHFLQCFLSIMLYDRTTLYIILSIPQMSRTIGLAKKEITAPAFSSTLLC